MEKRTRKNGFLCLFLSLVFVLGFAGNGWSAEGDDPCTVMRPDRETRLEWIKAYEDAPKAQLDERISIPLKGSYSLLSHLQYTPFERSQGSCGNCWAWAGTGVMGVALDIKEGMLDRLSVQYINSCANSAIGKICCDGGWLYHLADFYSTTTYEQAIPWSNTNAYWQDGDASCDTTCVSIATSPDYPIDFIDEVSIDTHGVGQATAIANIKNILHQDRAVWFGFFMPTWADWLNFRDNHWKNQQENDTWNPDFSCGHTWNNGGGHAVLCVGYNDDDPENRYWIMVNSWSTDGGDRPNGIFRLDMDMNYDCTFYDSGWYWSFYWQTLDIDWGYITPLHACCNTGGPGCIDPDIETAVCAVDPYCCESFWDPICVSEVTSVYGDTCDCCESHNQSEGCYRPDEPYPEAISDCVCAADPYCCEYFWDSLCVLEVEYLSCGCCSPPAPTNPDPSNGATGVPLDPILSWNNPAASSSNINENNSRATGIRTIDPGSVAPPVALAAERRPDVKNREIPKGINPNMTAAAGVNTIEPGSAAPGSVVNCACGGQYYTGAKVIALVDNPSGASGILAGHTGTVVCGSEGLPPILISWDDWNQGHDGNGHCQCPVSEAPDSSGWWVLCEEIGVVAVDCACDSQYATGQKVYALVDNPAAASGILAGHTGTVVCGSEWLPPILISWDDWNQGHDGYGYCQCPVSEAPDSSGWWVYCEEIAKCPVTYDVYLGTTGPTALICSDTSNASCDPGTLAGGITYHWQVVSKNPGGETLGPVWSFTTVLENDCPCDINNDGKCDMQDWLLFGGDWGRTDCGTPPGSGNPPNDCECDLNYDGKCDMQDWLIFGEDWGRTDCLEVRCEPQVCGEYTMDCNPDHIGECACVKTAEGYGSCVYDWPCDPGNTCESSTDCPGGYICAVDTCCVYGQCIEDNNCAPGSPGQPGISVDEGTPTIFSR